MVATAVFLVWLPSAAASISAGVAAACPCRQASLCNTVTLNHSQEVLGWGARGWTGFDWETLTMVAHSDTPELICKAHQHGVRVLLGVHMNPRGTNFSEILNATSRAEWIEESITEVKQRFADGLYFDYELPIARKEAPLIAAFTAYVKEVGVALRARIPGAKLVVATAWSPDDIDGRDYDYLGLSHASDYLFVMNYDTRSAIYGRCIASANAPLAKMARGIERYLDAGISESKLIYGLPWYGYDYACLNGTRPDAEYCPIAEVPFRGVNCTDAAGHERPYAAIMAQLEQNNRSSSLRWDKSTQSPYFNYIGADGHTVHQQWYDSPHSLGLKYRLASAHRLKGVGFYASSMLDPFGNATLPHNPHGPAQTAEMWASVRNNFINRTSERSRTTPWAKSDDEWTPTRQTAQQRQLMEQLEAKAAAASADATPAVLDLLRSVDFRAGLAECCPDIVHHSPAELLALLEEEVKAAELTHNFAPVNSPHTWENDISIATLENATYFYNLWELSFLGLARKNVAVDDKNGEVNLLGFPPFSGENGTQPATLAEAAQRPVYTTIAMLNDGLGNPTFGGVSAVFRNHYVANMTIIAPADTGNYEAACNRSSGQPSIDPAQCHFPFPLVCDGWPHPFQLGTFKSFHHIILANERLWNLNKTCTESPLMLTFKRLFRTTGVLSPLTAGNLMTFMEADIAGTPLFPDGIKLFVADTDLLFGTADGDALQKLCIKWGWVLAWAASGTRTANDSQVTSPTQKKWEKLPSVDQLRIIDPLVARESKRTVNVTVSTTALAKFVDMWKDANSTRSRAPGALWATMWDEMPAQLRLLGTIRGGLCANANECVGIDAHGDCVCY